MKKLLILSSMVIAFMNNANAIPDEDACPNKNNLRSILENHKDQIHEDEPFNITTVNGRGETHTWKAHDFIIYFGTLDKALDLPIMYNTRQPYNNWCLAQFHIEYYENALTFHLNQIK